jgi:hypothetical protein
LQHFCVCVRGKPASSWRVVMTGAALLSPQCTPAQACGHPASNAHFAACCAFCPRKQPQRHQPKPLAFYHAQWKPRQAYCLLQHSSTVKGPQARAPCIQPTLAGTMRPGRCTSASKAMQYERPMILRSSRCSPDRACKTAHMGLEDCQSSCPLRPWLLCSE